MYTQKSGYLMIIAMTCGYTSFLLSAPRNHQPVQDDKTFLHTNNTHTANDAVDNSHFSYITNGDGELTLDEMIAAVSHIVEDIVNITADPSNMVTVGSNVIDILASVADVAMEAMRDGELSPNATVKEFLIWVENKKLAGQKITRANDKNGKKEETTDSIFDAVIGMLKNFANIIAHKNNPAVVGHQATEMLAGLITIAKEGTHLRSAPDSLKNPRCQKQCKARIITEAKDIWAQQS